MKTIRVLAAKPGLDGHDRGIKVLCTALRNAGMEVIYTGLRQTPEGIAHAALDEDVDVVALSILSGAHNELLPRIAQLLKENEGENILVLAGGLIPDSDIPFLMSKGIHRVFSNAEPLAEIEAYIREHAA